MQCKYFPVVWCGPRVRGNLPGRSVREAEARSAEARGSGGRLQVGQIKHRLIFTFSQLAMDSLELCLILFLLICSHLKTIDAFIRCLHMKSIYHEKNY